MFLDLHSPNNSIEKSILGHCMTLLSINSTPKRFESSFIEIHTKIGTFDVSKYTHFIFAEQCKKTSDKITKKGYIQYEATGIILS